MENEGKKHTKQHRIPEQQIPLTTLEERPELEFRKFMFQLIYGIKDDKINELIEKMQELKCNFNKEI